MSSLVVMAAGREGPGSWFVVGLPMIVLIWLLVMAAIGVLRARKVILSRQLRAARDAAEVAEPGSVEPHRTAQPERPAARPAQTRELHEALGELRQLLGS